MNNKIIAIILALSISGCGPALVATIKDAPNRTPDQVKMDGLECGQKSTVTYFPFLFGIGILISRSIAKDRYSDCMTEKGYIVDS